MASWWFFTDPFEKIMPPSNWIIISPKKSGWKHKKMFRQPPPNLPPFTMGFFPDPPGGERNRRVSPKTPLRKWRPRYTLCVCKKFTTGSAGPGPGDGEAGDAASTSPSSPPKAFKLGFYALKKHPENSAWPNCFCLFYIKFRVLVLHWGWSLCCSLISNGMRVITYPTD